MNLGADTLIIEILQAVIEGVTEGRPVLRTLLPGVLSEEDERRFLAMWRENPPRVTQGYPRQAGPWPQWSVFLASETAVIAPFGFETHDYEVTDASTKGIFVTETIEVRTYARNAMYGRILHLLARSAILTGDKWLLGAKGVEGWAYQGSRDIAPMPDYIPEDVWGRSQTWQCQAVAAARVALPDDVLRPPALVGLWGEVVGPEVAGRVKIQ